MQSAEEGFQSSRGAVQVFLNELRNILNSKDCLVFLPTREDKEEKYSNRYCLSKLGYDVNSAVEELKKLKVSNYYKTVKDENNNTYNEYYYEFGKVIHDKMVYIKVKIVSRDNKQILCMSFHFPKFDMTRFPYK